MNTPLIIALLSASALAASQEEYVAPAAPHHREDSLGPVLRTGRYRVLQERILGAENDYPQPLHLGRQPFVQGEHPERPFLHREETPRASAEHFTYNGPNDGRRVFIYRRVHTPVRITNGVIERVGPSQTVERWAEGGYQGAQTHNVEVFHRVGQDVFADRTIPVKNVLNRGEEFL